MALYNDFNTAKTYGKKGETAVKQLLELSGFKVNDVANDSNYFHCGDLIAEKNNNSLFIEVKTDSYAAETGNLVVELITNIAWNKDGWFRVSTADKFAFYLEQSNEVILIDAKELKENYKDAIKRFVKTEQYEMGQFYKQGLIALLSINILSNLSSFRRISLNT